MTDANVIFVNESKLLQLQGRIAGLSPSDMVCIVENKDAFLKLVDLQIEQYKINLGECGYIGKEQVVYNAIEALQELKKSIENSNVAYGKYIQEVTKAGKQVQ